MGQPELAVPLFRTELPGVQDASEGVAQGELD